MRRVRVGIVGAGALTESAIVPVLSGLDAWLPSDEGAWWLRRPGGNVDIPYQPPFRPDVVALCDPDPRRLERVGLSARVRGLYRDWRVMLAETSVDVLICALPPALTDELLCDLGTRRLQNSARWVWIAGPPAVSSSRARELAKLHAGRFVWCARLLSQALAHRAALRMVGRGDIGEVRALALRWPSALPRPRDLQAASPSSNIRAFQEASGQLASAYSALDLLVTFAQTCRARQMPTSLGVPIVAGRLERESTPEASASEEPSLPSLARSVAVHDFSGATSALVCFPGGVAATALFAGAEAVDPLPRLEVCGSQGRFLVCEGGRRVELHAPREGARVWTPASLSPLFSTPDAMGVAEELRLFLECWARAQQAPRSALRPAASLGVPSDATLLRASGVLGLWEQVSEPDKGASEAEHPNEIGGDPAVREGRERGHRPGSLPERPLASSPPLAPGVGERPEPRTLSLFD
jgi:predicted dehydrogenase